ncbi:hypothetical protein LIN78_16190 [Leeia sp. TBRC 13508]|uniref:ATP-binding protein n=1 Tax=Leeia speluncae TaxID=2884804 RepID=A0ABS8DBS8_9NEIS|nr:hypothetical protein [Leeia speluncae]MCB6185088.1 hypothetical protein [Leeia speluncae]
MINFPKTITIEACEKTIADIINGKSASVLRLPVGTTGYASSFGGLASAIQVINTWARLSDTRALALNKSVSNDEIEDLIKKPHKFVAAMFAKSISLTNKPENDLKLFVNTAARKAIEDQAQSPFGQKRGGLCWFAFVDHSSKGFDPNFYIAKSESIPVPRQPDQFNALIQKMVGQALVAPGAGKKIAANDMDALGRIFYELFLNTHEHGSRDSSRGTWLKPGVRIVYVQGVNLRKSSAGGNVEYQPNLSNYHETVARKYPDERQIRFMEIGIVDSGLGYCDRWLADQNISEGFTEISIEDEYSIFKKCFNFRQSSTLKDSKGNGLPVVMDRLTRLGGFMRIRSGRLGLFRNFISSPYESDKSPEFFDWESNDVADINVTSMPRACGVAISMLIPLEAK